MRPSRFTHDEVLQALQQVAGGTPAVRVCRAMGITQTTFYRWRRAHERGPAGEPPGMRALRAENLGLKQLVAELMLEIKAGIGKAGVRAKPGSERAERAGSEQLL